MSNSYGMSNEYYKYFSLHYYSFQGLCHQTYWRTLTESYSFTKAVLSNIAMIPTQYPRKWMERMLLSWNVTSKYVKVWVISVQIWTLTLKYTLEPFFPSRIHTKHIERNVNSTLTFSELVIMYLVLRCEGTENTGQHGIT